MSLTVETMQLVGKVGSFAVDDLLLNTIGGFVGHLGADETLVYHRDLKLCHESHRGNDAARRQGWKFRCG